MPSRAGAAAEAEWAAVPARRVRILEAAVDLFGRRGFHAVGVDEIGAASGITGPGVYRHFPSKQALLVALFDRVCDRLLDGARAILDSCGHSGEALEALVRFHVSFALDDRRLIAVYLQEEQNLPEADRRRLRRRQRLYVEEWAQALAERRPDLGDAEVRAVVHGAIGLLHSVAYHESGLGREAVADLLAATALAALCDGRRAGSRPAAPA